ncbi:charged multivesicular body protein 4c [Ornithorhynchus anatinus]|uniref:Charged multivesicular body protein 4C n=1 Tax=Ornithorhynchus anatinus TaxID=9258 RepID=F7G5G6_ORNAN|nr:charged multivesicular body protein 4c [Ornithorhynchus anatinus]
MAAQPRGGEGPGAGLSRGARWGSRWGSRWGWGSRPPPDGPPDPRQVVARLGDSERELRQRQAALEARIEAELARAKDRGTGDRRAALQALKRKKRFEKQLSQIDGILSTVEFQREALENAHTNTEVLRNLDFAAKVVKAVHKPMDLNKIDDLMQEVTEQQDRAQEMSDAFSQRVGFGDDFDEDELMAELLELEQEEMKKTKSIRLPSVPSPSLFPAPSRLPSRPSTSHQFRGASSKRTEDDGDGHQLTAWAS